MLLVDLGEPLMTVKIGDDNQAWLSIVSNPEGDGRVKHIDIAHHMVRDRVARGEVEFYYVPTAQMGADSFTKTLPEAAFTMFRSRMGVRTQDQLTWT